MYNNNHKKIIASLIAGLFIHNSCADEIIKKQPDPHCSTIKQSGSLILDGGVCKRILTNTEDVNPDPGLNNHPSVEYRRPDEVYLINEPTETHAEETPSEKVTQKTSITTTLNNNVKNVGFNSGNSQISDGEKEQILQLVKSLSGKRNIRISITGHADEQKLSPPKKELFKSNIGLSEARAAAAANFIRENLQEENSIKITGEGDTKPLVFCDKHASIKDYQACLAPNRRIEIQVWYDAETESNLPEPTSTGNTDRAPLTKTDCASTHGIDANLPFRVSVDGEPVDLNDKSNSADVTRCTDVLLAHSEIQVRYDGLEETKFLNVAAERISIFNGTPVKFNAYSNYMHWIDRSEVRIFKNDDSLQSKPLAILTIDENNSTTWISPEMNPLSKLKYVLRVYSKDGKFDETSPQVLTVESSNLSLNKSDPIIAYGENRLSLHNIDVHGGAVTVNGDQLKDGQVVSFLGQVIPVDKNGKFAAKQILPAGSHVVNVSVKNADGTDAMSFNRNLYIPDNDWFYIALGDLTAGRNSTSGPAKLVTGDTQHFDNKAYVDGRLAFYLKGKVKGEYLLTAAADTQEQPLGDLFTNFTSKDPQYLLRRLDPDRYYPVYGDDSTTIEDAPTRGKFYVKLARGDSHVLWGSFRTQLPGSDLVQYSRGMYGAGAKLRSQESTSFGQKKTQLDGFVGDPGTLGTREQFRGTGGSLYYVQHTDISRGSDRLWIEIRDKDSGIVLKSTPLTPVQDYDFDPIQGRILLRSPLPSTSDDNQLLRSGSLSGNPIYLMATYEYVPSITQINNMTAGGRASEWINDHLQVGVTGYKQGDTATRQEVMGVDGTYRVSAGVYIKAETAKSSGKGTDTQSSSSGGFSFNPISSVGGDATASRIEASVNLAEISKENGKVTAYYQEREKGFSSPGMVTNEDIQQSGINSVLDINKSTQFSVKSDIKRSTSQDTTALSATIKNQINKNWDASIGIRNDEMSTRVANASALLSQNGDRLDAGVQIGYAPNSDKAKPDWRAYGFFQDTLNSSGNRKENNRIGFGGNWQALEKLNLSAEASSGNGGVGGKLGGDWQVTEKTQLYMNYALDSDRTDGLYRGRQGTLVSGEKTRYSDSLSVYGEERMMHGSGPSGLLHAFGLDLAGKEGWNYGFKGETGTLSDPLSGDFDRQALSFSVGRAVDKIKYAGNIEWRDESGSKLGDRTTWLVRNSIGYQVKPDWRFLGKLNFSISDSSLGSTYNADFTELVLGYAYRPVKNDKLNALLKYTYYENQPSPAALSANGLTGYKQKSNIISADAIYDLKPWLSVGGKYGYRQSDIMAANDPAGWQNSDGQLLIGRLDWHFVHKWDALLEVRRLDVPAANDTRQGCLAAIYRHVNDSVKAGGGYNFTDFSDDMTDQSYRSHGWFINVTGKL